VRSVYGKASTLGKFAEGQRVKQFEPFRRQAGPTPRCGSVRYFDTSPEFWMNLQQLCELRRAAEQIGAGFDAIPRGKARGADHGHAEPRL
jgi:hypothetical protein